MDMPLGLTLKEGGPRLVLLPPIVICVPPSGHVSLGPLLSPHPFPVICAT
jgi:hypothetical protein